MFDNSIYSFTINKKRERPDSPILKITNNFKKIKLTKAVGIAGISKINQIKKNGPL